MLSMNVYVIWRGQREIEVVVMHLRKTDEELDLFRPVS